jgi:hypothetical protein
MLRCKGCGEQTPPVDVNGRGFCESCSNVRVHKGYTREELSEAFDRVKDRENWKMPIDKSLAGELGAADRSAIEAAVVFYAGCVPTFKVEGGLCGAMFTRVTAPGYYVAVGA